MENDFWVRMYVYVVLLTFPVGGGIILAACLIVWSGYSASLLTLAAALVFVVFMLLDRLPLSKTLKSLGGVLILVTIGVIISAQLIIYDCLTPQGCICWAIGPTLWSLFVFVRAHYVKHIVA